jgi:predicted ATP-grasp superfamily ATP-dependent carboligase
LITKEDIGIRYGVWSYPEKDYRFKIIINKAPSVYLCRDKLFSFQQLRDASIRIPRFYENKEDIDIFPVLARRFDHSRGTDIAFINNSGELSRDNSDYYVEFIESIFEYRTLIMFNECVRLSIKVPYSEDCDINIRNYSHGWEFVDSYIGHQWDLEKKIIEESIKAIKAIRLDFGAVDSIIDTNEEAIVLEVNSSPHLNLYGRELFSYILLKHLGLPCDIVFNRIRERQSYRGRPYPIHRELIRKDKMNIGIIKVI